MNEAMTSKETFAELRKFEQRQERNLRGLLKGVWS